MKKQPMSKEKLLKTLRKPGNLLFKADLKHYKKSLDAWRKMYKEMRDGNNSVLNKQCEKT